MKIVTSCRNNHLIILDKVIVEKYIYGSGKLIGAFKNKTLASSIQNIKIASNINLKTVQGVTKTERLYINVNTKNLTGVINNERI